MTQIRIDYDEKGPPGKTFPAALSVFMKQTFLNFERRARISRVPKIFGRKHLSQQRQRWQLRMQTFLRRQIADEIAADRFQIRTGNRLIEHRADMAFVGLVIRHGAIF